MGSPVSQPLICNSCIVTLDSPNADVLRKPTKEVNIRNPQELSKAIEIGRRLVEALKPHLPAAGMAAPQLGVSDSVFVFSRDRQHHELAINPSFTPIGTSKIRGWEGCFSTMETKEGFQIALVDRFETIRARYFDAKGLLVDEVMDGFAAKVFQHEMDHLLGILNINRPEAEVKKFSTKEAMQAFMVEVKRLDAQKYQSPQASDKSRSS